MTVSSFAKAACRGALVAGAWGASTAKPGPQRPPVDLEAERRRAQRRVGHAIAMRVRCSFVGPGYPPRRPAAWSVARPGRAVRAAGAAATERSGDAARPRLHELVA
jgi:hypothetical protein